MFILLTVLYFVLIYTILINIHEYNFQIVCILGHQVNSLCNSIKLVPRLVVLDSKQLRCRKCLHVHPLVFYDFTLLSNVLINIHEYGNLIICISEHRIKVLCLNIQSAPSLKVSDELLLRY